MTGASVQQVLREFFEADRAGDPGDSVEWNEVTFTDTDVSGRRQLQEFGRTLDELRLAALGPEHPERCDIGIGSIGVHLSFSNPAFYRMREAYLRRDRGQSE